MRSENKSLEFWQAHISAQKESTLSIRKYCIDHKLTKHQFYYYKRKLEDKSTPSPRLLPIVVKSAPTIHLKVNGVHLEIPSTTSPSWLAKILLEMGDSQ